MKFEKMLKLAGKNDFTLDKDIPWTYLFRKMIQYGFMLLRGMFLKLYGNKSSHKVFIGSGVKLYAKQKIHLGAYTKIHNRVKIDALSKSGVWIGRSCVFGENSIIECTGTLSHMGEGLFIGDNTSFGANCYFGAAGGIKIGDNVICGQGIRFHSENHNFKDKDISIKDQGVTRKGIKIGSNCWIGAGAVFLDGAEIGDGCVVAANALVTKKFDDDSIIMGIPARLKAKR